MTANRALKLKLFEECDKCYYCKCQMILTNISSVSKGQSLPANAATIEHLVSRLSPHRWKKKLKGEKRKVLACYSCNQEKSKLEILCLSRADILNRSKGFSLSPRGKPKIVVPLPTIKEVLKVLNA